LPLALVWRKDDLSPLLAKFVTDVGSLVKRKQSEPPSSGLPGRDHRGLWVTPHG
jgi:hypothetical protein